MKRSLWALLLVLFLVGCGGSSSSDLPFSLSGSWRFTGHSNALSLDFGGVATVSQNMDVVTGIVGFEMPCGGGQVLTGTVSGTTVNLELGQSGQQINFTGTVANGGGSMSGTYTAPLGACSTGDSGTWSATKT